MTHAQLTEISKLVHEKLSPAITGREFRVHVEWPGTIDVLVDLITGKTIMMCYGTANTTWNGNLYTLDVVARMYDGPDENETMAAMMYTSIPSDSTDFEFIASVIAVQARMVALEIENGGTPNAS